MPSGTPTTGSTAALAVERVSKQFGDVVALDDVSLRVPSGALVAFVGESGSGKTTLLRTFNRLIDPDTGVVRLDGADLAMADPIALRRRVGYVPQDGGLLPHWRVQRNVELVLRLRDDPRRSDRARAALDAVGLAPARFADRWPRELSGGQRQRVAIARALAAEPDVLLLDEPFGALDAITRADLHATFAALRARLRMTAVLVTHDLHEAVLLASHIAVMRAGRVEQFDSTAVVIGSPATEYVETLLRRAGVL